MIEKIKDKINKINISLQLLESTSNSLYDFISLCQLIAPQYDFFQKDSDYNVEIPIFLPQPVYKEIINIFTPLSEVFFDNKRFMHSSELERQYIKTISNNLHGKGQEDEEFIIGLFTIYQKSQLQGWEYITAKKVKKLLDPIILTLNKLKKLKDLELLKVTSQKDYDKMSNEINILNQCLKYNQNLSDYIQRTVIGVAVKYEANVLIERINSIMKNRHCKIYSNSIQNALKFFSEGIDNNVVSIRFIHSLIELLDQEIKEASKTKDYEESILVETSEYLETTTQKRNTQNNIHKIKEFQEESTNNQKIIEVYSQARDVNTAIKHAEKGKELQLYFINKQAQDLIDDLKQEEIEQKSNVPDKSDINKWYKYGTDKDGVKKISNMKETNFGISVKDILKESGLDPGIFDNFKKGKS